MNAIRVRVPGKVVLIGEYVVIEGAPAVVMAVDRYARVRIEPCSPGACRFDPSQAGVAPLAFRLRANGAVEFSGPLAPDLARSAALLDRLARFHRRHHDRLVPFRVAVDTRPLHDRQTGIKLGLGSSAAVAVGLDRGLRELLGGVAEAPRDTLCRLLPVYRLGQGDRGSGIDLAAALYGGVVRFQWCSGEVRIAPVDLPERLLLDFVWTGRPASTGAYLERYANWCAERPDESTRLREAMAATARAAEQALVRNDADAVLVSMQRYGGQMATMGRRMGADLLGGVHGAVRDRAEALGLAYKPTGAGGGDLGVIAGTDPDRMAKMRQWLGDSAIACPVLRPAAGGAMVEPPAPGNPGSGDD